MTKSKGVSKFVFYGSWAHRWTTGAATIWRIRVELEPIASNRRTAAKPTLRIVEP
jgi:hypothetical protein